MAVPSYTTDLVTVTAAEDTTNWNAIGGGASGLGVGPDLAMQGTNCVDKSISAAEKGQLYNNGSAISLPTGAHCLIWIFFSTPGVCDSLANRGVCAIVGSGLISYVRYHVEGNDTFGAAPRVARCHPIDYSVRSSNTGSVPYRTVIGAPTANPQVFGGSANVTATVRGANLGIDAIRYGKGLYIEDGEASTPATFSGAASTDNASANRWGLLTFVLGSIYELQGKFAIGQDNTDTASVAYFVDANKTINVVDTPHAAASFNRVTIDGASTYVSMTNITFESLGTIAAGQFYVINSSTVVELNDCTFVKMGLFVLNSGVECDGCTWRQPAQLITQAGATITNSVISGCTAAVALLSNNPSLLSGTSFESSGTGHAIELNTPGTYTLTDNTFTGYGADGTTNAAIYNNSGGAVTLNVSGGTVPTVRNGSGASTTVNASVTVTIEANVSLVGAEIRIYDLDNSPAGSLGTELAGVESSVSSTYSYGGTAGNVIWIQIMLTGYEEFGQQFTVPSSAATFTATLRADLNL